MASISRWRERARDAITASLAATIGQPVAARIAALDAVYPFGPREYHPYKIWLSERKRAIASLAEGPIDVTCPACGAGPKRKCKPIAAAPSAQVSLGLIDDTDVEVHAARMHRFAGLPIHEVQRG